jgi:hypothetical protein
MSVAAVSSHQADPDIQQEMRDVPDPAGRPLIVGAIPGEPSGFRLRAEALAKLGRGGAEAPLAHVVIGMPGAARHSWQPGTHGPDWRRAGGCWPGSTPRTSGPCSLAWARSWTRITWEVSAFGALVLTTRPTPASAVAVMTAWCCRTAA